MTVVNTKLVKDGNSVAVRLPKTVLAMSGLQSNVQMEVQPGRVVLRPARTPRAGWKQQIARVAADSDSAAKPDPELNDWESTNSDGLDQAG